MRIYSKLALILLSIGLSGCGVHLKNIIVTEYPTYRLFIAEGEWAPQIVNKHCRRGTKPADLKHDNGDPIPATEIIRACTIPHMWPRKPEIIVPRQNILCIPHEICHVDNPENPEYCQKYFPCAGEGIK